MLISEHSWVLCRSLISRNSLDAAGPGHRLECELQHELVLMCIMSFLMRCLVGIYVPDLPELLCSLSFLWTAIADNYTDSLCLCTGKDQRVEFEPLVELHSSTMHQELIRTVWYPSMEFGQYRVTREHVC